jgi:hypothetical protein
MRTTDVRWFIRPASLRCAGVTRVRWGLRIALCAMAGLALLALPACRTQPRGPAAAGSATTAPRPSVRGLAPGESVPLHPVTLGTITPLVGTATNLGVETAPLDEMTGKVERMGPFTPEDGLEGQWLLLGATYVLIPDRLWMASQDLHINVGVRIRVIGDWERERGRKFLRARSVTRES